MEIMASLPSVVLGFLAAIYIAPLVETRIPSLLLVSAGVPLVTLLLGWFWSTLPTTVRKHIKPGYEAFAFLPVVLVIVAIFWSLGPAFERMAFVITDANGQKIADFRYWWPVVTGASFEQRNSLVVGFMMGFAVIPIIFTITDDALSNVPPALRTASFACGASRWQTAVRVVLADGLGRHLFCRDDRAGPSSRRDNDCRDGDRKHSGHGVEYLLGNANSLGKYRSRIARGSAIQHALPYALPWSAVPLYSYLRGQHDCRDHASAPSREIQDGLDSTCTPRERITKTSSRSMLLLASRTCGSPRWASPSAS